MISWKESLPATTGTESRGMAIFTWHDGKSRYDEVAWVPEYVTSERAVEIGRAKLHADDRATRVQVAFNDWSFLEFIRYAV
jgi:hypothetical protein